MTIYRFRSFKEAERTLWNFQPDNAYYENIRNLFELAARLRKPEYPHGIFKYPTLEEANRQRFEWDLGHLERVYHKSTDFRESEEWDIQQHVSMTPEERQKAAAELRKRVYGEDVPDVRQFHRKK